MICSTEKGETEKTVTEIFQHLIEERVVGILIRLSWPLHLNILVTGYLRQ